MRRPGSSVRRQTVNLGFVNPSALAKIYPHLIIRVSRSLDPVKANFLFARDLVAIRTEHMSDYTSGWIVPRISDFIRRPVTRINPRPF